MSEAASIQRLEIILEQHDDLIRRCVQSMEKQIQIDERLANHLEVSRNRWAAMDEQNKRLEALSQQVAGLLEFSQALKKFGWWALGIVSLGFAFFVRFWVETH